MPSVISTDVLIVGAGVAGLWLNARLRRQGFSTVVVENATLGGGQSVKSQGIIHGGAKYALHGALTGASEAIADMPRRWREALAGQRRTGPDRRAPAIRSPLPVVPGTLAGNLTSFFASKAVRGRVDQVKGDALPPALQDRRFKGKVYRLSELVVDVPSLIGRLAQLAGDGLLAGQHIEPLRENDASGRPESRRPRDPRPAHRLERRRRHCRSARRSGPERAGHAKASAAHDHRQRPRPETAVRPLPGRRHQAAPHRDHAPGRRWQLGVVHGRRYRRGRRRSTHATGTDRHRAARVGASAAVDRHEPHRNGPPCASTAPSRCNRA